jgi:hypothetical protein
MGGSVTWFAALLFWTLDPAPDAEVFLGDSFSMFVIFRGQPEYDIIHLLNLLLF